MYKISEIRLNPQEFDRGMKARGIEDINSQIVLQYDEEIRHIKTTLQDLQKRRNALAKEIGLAKSKGDEQKSRELTAQAEEVNKKIPDTQREVDDREKKLQEILELLPNIPDVDVPFGGENDAVEIKQWGRIPVFSFPPKQHYDLGEGLLPYMPDGPQMDFKTAVQLSGSRFVLLAAHLARLERALSQYMLDNAYDAGYTEISCPVLVLEKAMYNVGQLPKFAEDSFLVDGKYRLIPTSEAVLTNIVAEKILNIASLPLRFTAYTPCFRSEAGSAGKDTRGMIRMHQFNKVELVSIVAADKSREEHEYMLSTAEKVLQGLNLPYRIITLASQDMSFTSHKTYDIEVWLPGANKYREISSCSRCGSFQAKRMGAYYVDAEKNKAFVHTLNGSSLAVGRALVAVLENYQQEDGSVVVPDALVKYMGGINVIPVIE